MPSKTIAHLPGNACRVRNYRNSSKKFSKFIARDSDLPPLMVVFDAAAGTYIPLKIITYRQVPGPVRIPVARPSKQVVALVAVRKPVYLRHFFRVFGACNAQFTSSGQVRPEPPCLTCEIKKAFINNLIHRAFAGARPNRHRDLWDYLRKNIENRKVIREWRQVAPGSRRET